MAFTIVTGRSDQDHVTSDDMGNLYALTQGSGRYALDDIECTVIDANTVHVSAGNLLIDGRHFRNSAEGTNLNIANGLPGMNRIDLIVAQYTYETIGEDYLEYGNLVVIQGTPTSGTPEVPECEGGSILNNDAIVEVPLFTIPISGVAVGTPSDCLLSAYELPIDRGGTGGGTAAAARAGLSVPSKADLGNVAASVAPVEQSTATANHAVGSYLILDNVLYKVTTAIATGETIAEGTNVTATDLNTELGSIQNSLGDIGVPIRSRFGMDVRLNLSVPGKALLIYSGETYRGSIAINDWQD